MDEASQLAAYIYRVRFGDETSYLDDRRYSLFYHLIIIIIYFAQYNYNTVQF